jgi:ribulose-phosphate 3-epimerase
MNKSNLTPKKSDLVISPSILAGDFGHLADEAKRIEDSGADRVHIDIMDGHFVPNLTLGPRAVAAINRSTEMFLEVHIMVYNPFDYIERFVESGADMIMFHFEATEEVQETIDYIHKCNIRAGLAFCPETSASMMINYLDKCDMILLMTVNPGFGGQAFMPEVLDKVRFARETCNKLKIGPGNKLQPEARPSSSTILDIEVDGGINDETALQCLNAGANVLVSGTHLFQLPNMRKGVEQLRSLGA